MEGDSKVTASTNAVLGNYSGSSGKVTRYPNGDDEGVYEFVSFSFEVVCLILSVNVGEPEWDAVRGKYEFVVTAPIQYRFETPGEVSVINLDGTLNYHVAPGKSLNVMVIATDAEAAPCSDTETVTLTASGSGGSGSGSAINFSHQVTLQVANVNLPGVTDAPGFTKSLNQMADNSSRGEVDKMLAQHGNNDQGMM